MKSIQLPELTESAYGATRDILWMYFDSIDSGMIYPGLNAGIFDPFRFLMVTAEDFPTPPYHLPHLIDIQLLNEGSAVKIFSSICTVLLTNESFTEEDVELQKKLENLPSFPDREYLRIFDDAVSCALLGDNEGFFALQTEAYNSYVLRLMKEPENRCAAI